MTRRRHRGRRLLAAGLAGLCLLATTACDVAAGGEADSGAVRVAASMSILADFVGEVGGDLVEVASLVPVGADPHTHEPTPADARAVADADLVVYNGFALEPWLGPLLNSAGGEVLRAAGGLDAVADSDGAPDPHLWMVPTLAVSYVERVADGLAAVDPANADVYAANAERYVRELVAVDAEVTDRLAAIPPERRKLVTSHDAYSYFADHYGLEVVETVVGVTTEEQPSARQVRRVVDAIRREGVPTIFVETTVNPAVMERIATDAGVAIGEPLYGDSVGEPGSGAEDYAGMLLANADALVAGLGADR